MTELKTNFPFWEKDRIPSGLCPEVLEAFDNKHPGNDYWVRSTAPNSPASVPSRGNRIFAEILLLVYPRCQDGESKSLKLYLFSFRNHGAFTRIA